MQKKRFIVLRLIKFEIRKIFGVKLILALLVLVVLSNAIILFNSFDESLINRNKEMNSFVQIYSKNTEEIEKHISNYMEKYREVVYQRRLTGDRTIPLPENVYSNNDYELFINFSKNIKNYKSTYTEKIGESIKIAKARIAEYEYLGYSNNSFEMIYQRGIIDSYERLLELEFPINSITGFDLALSYNGFAVVYIFSLIVGGMILIIPERVNGMIGVLKIAKKGRLHSIVAKLITAFLFCIIICLIINASSLIIIGLKTGFNGANNPIQMIEEYRLCPFEITVIQGMLMSVCISILSGYVFMLVIIAIASIFKRYVFSFLISFIFASLNYVAANYPYLNNYNIFKNLNFFWSITGFEIIKCWRGISLFGSGISLFDSITIVYLLLMIVLLAIIISNWCFGKDMVNRKEYHLIRIFKTKYTSFFASIKKAKRLKVKSIIYFETKKVLTPFSFFVLALLLFLNVYLSYVSFNYSSSYQDNLYHQYMEQFGGKWTEEKADEIEIMVEKYSEIVSQKTSVETDYYSGKINVSELANYYNLYYDAEKRLDVVTELNNLSERLRELKKNGNDVFFVDKQGWEMLKNTNYSYLYFFAVILILSDIYSKEYRTGFEKYQKTMKQFGKVNVAKLSISILIPIVIVAFCEIYQFVYVAMRYGLNYFNASSISLPFFENGNLSILSTYLLNYLKIIVILALFGLVVALISRITRRLMATIIIASAIVFVPILMSYFGLHILDNISLVNICSIR